MAVTCCLPLKCGGRWQLELLVHIALFFLLNWLICWMKSEVYIYGDEKRYSFSSFLRLCNLYMDQTAVNLKWRLYCASTLLPALLLIVNQQGVFPWAEGEGKRLVLKETFRTETGDDKFQGNTEHECLFPFLPLTKIACLLLWNILCLFCFSFATLWAKLLALDGIYQVKLRSAD